MGLNENHTQRKYTIKYIKGEKININGLFHRSNGLKINNRTKEPSDPIEW